MKKYILIFLLLFTVSFQEVHADSLVTGITEGYESTSVTITSSEEYNLFINGEVYLSGTNFSTIGYHVLEVQDQEANILETIHFTIHPQFSESTINKQTFEDYVTLNLLNQEGSILLVNGDVQTSSTRYNEIGNYVVYIVGENNYQRIYRFEIVPSVLEQIDETSINESVRIDITNLQEIFINNELITNDTTISQFGNYEIQVQGINGFHKTYQFTLNIPSETITNTIYSDELYIDITNAVNVYLNDILLTESTTITAIGNHTITYVGINGFEQIYNITIETDYTYQENETYKEFSLENINAEVYLNYRLYEQGKTINEVGNYTVTILGNNNYRKEISFTIRPDLNVYHTGTYREFKINDIGGELLLNNKAVSYNKTIDIIGNYTLLIKGVNGYTETIEFQVLHDYDIFDNETLEKPTSLDFNVVNILVNGETVEKGYRLYKTGDYEITLLGNGGYSETYTLSYTNPHQDLYSTTLITSIVLSVITLVIFVPVLIRRLK